MKVKLMGYTQTVPETFIGIDNLQDFVAYCARVSNPTNQMNSDTAEKLIKYLIKHKHWSPFELANMCVEIQTSRAIAAQILRHRSFSFQEFSQRYSKATEMEPLELRAPAEKNRQSSSEIVQDEYFNRMAAAFLEGSKQMYDQLIAAGVAKECARMILPLNTQTTMYMNGSIRSWIHYIELRSANGTQKEHMDIANSCKDIFKKQFPVIAEALDW